MNDNESQGGLAQWHLLFQHQHQDLKGFFFFFFFFFSSKSSSGIVLGLLAALLILLCIYWYLWVRKAEIYLLDYSCATCVDEYKTNLETLLYFYLGHDSIAVADAAFQFKVFLKSGIGEEAYVPRVNLELGRRLRLKHSHELAAALLLAPARRLLKKAGVNARDIDVLVVNSGTFSPTPSLASAIVAELGMREDVRAFELDGMGCSASLIAIGLAAGILRNGRRPVAGPGAGGRRRPRLALVASTEVINAFYEGSDRSMMVTNCLFRAAGNAVLLSSRRADRGAARLQLVHLARVNTAARDDSYGCVVIGEDGSGHVGAKLSPQLLRVAGAALARNLTGLAPRVLPAAEIARLGAAYLGAWARRGLRDLRRRAHDFREELKSARSRRRRPDDDDDVPPDFTSPDFRSDIPDLKEPDPAAPVPDFKLAFDHFCIHPGGKAVILGIGSSLRLPPSDLEPSLMALHRFGNTSCSGIWYILAYMHAQRRLLPGHRVLQIGLGSGFKCTTAVWKVVGAHPRDRDPDPDCPWSSCIHRYPVNDPLSSLPHVQDIVAYVTRIQEQLHGAVKL